MPPYLAPYTGSTTTPATAENTFLSIDLVPIARPLATFDGSQINLFDPRCEVLAGVDILGILSTSSPILSSETTT